MQDIQWTITIESKDGKVQVRYIVDAPTPMAAMQQVVEEWQTSSPVAPRPEISRPTKYIEGI